MAPVRSMWERMVAGDAYLADDPELVARRRRAAQLCARFDRTLGDEDEGGRVLRELLARVGEGSVVLPPFRCDYGTNITMGARVFANYGCVFLDVAPIRIGDHAQFGPGAQLLTATHPIDPDERRSGWESGRPITLGDDVWIGAGAIVLGGVTIGDAAVVGAGAVVTRDVPARTVVAGNPARLLRTLDDERLGADG